MNCGTQKAVRLLKELDSEKGIGLVEKRRLGLGKPNGNGFKDITVFCVP